MFSPPLQFCLCSHFQLNFLSSRCLFYILSFLSSFLVFPLFSACGWRCEGETSQKAQPNTDLQPVSQSFSNNPWSLLPCQSQSGPTTLNCVMCCIKRLSQPHINVSTDFCPVMCTLLSSSPHLHFLSHTPLSVPSAKKAQLTTLKAPVVQQSGTSVTPVHRGILPSINRPICTNCCKNSPTPSLC